MIETDTKEEFLRAVSGSYDQFVADTGTEPMGIVYVLGSPKESLGACWHMTKDCKGMSLAMLGVALAAISQEIAS